MSILRSRYWKHYIKYGSLAAIVYSIAVSFFCRDASFKETWLLFAGNLGYMIIIAASLFSFNRQNRDNAGTVPMLAAGHITTIAGIIIACLLCFILLLIYVPGFIESGTPSKLMQDEPVNIVRGKTNGLVFMVFMSATMGNFVAGFAASIIFSFTLKRNQTKEEFSPGNSEL